MVKRERGPGGGSGGKAAKSPKPSPPWVEFILQAAKSFDPLKDEHPAKFVVQTLTPDIIEPFEFWLNSLVDNVLPRADAIRMPVGSEPIPFQLPLVCFAMHQPVDGFPCLADWLNTLNDIACGGFEAHREPTEIRPLPTQTLGQRLGPLRVVPTKGWGRLSCVWFCLLYTWKAGPGGRDLNDEEMAALKRFAVTVIQINAVYIHLERIEHFNYRRFQLNQQMAERQKKNALQTVQLFNDRAKRIMEERPELKANASGYKSAFLQAVQEYNAFGLAENNSKYQLEDAVAEQLYLFKVGISDDVWNSLERHLHQYRMENSAFGRDTLLCPRWLLESTKPGVNDLWHEILRVTEPKQNVFIDRVIHVHQIMVQRQTSKSQTVRMTMAQWLQEVDVCCLIFWTGQQMYAAVDPDKNGARIFEDKTIEDAAARAIEGDFHEDFKVHLECMDGSFEASHTLMWKEFKPKSDMDQSTIDDADELIEKADAEAITEKIKNDQLKLSRDVAQIGRLAERESGNARSQRLRKITHLKQQNSIGACEVQKFMTRQCPHVHFESPDLEQEIIKLMSDVSGCIIWIDCMKYGTMSQKLLNNLVTTLNKIIRQKPKQSCAFMIGPYLCSDRVASGSRGERARIEEKLDAKSLWSLLVSLRCEIPPNVKRVPLQFNGWLICCDGLDEWSFQSCMMYRDRGNRHLLPWAPENSWKVPTDGKDSVPRSAEGTRSMSDAQESAQLLSGSDLPNTILDSLLNGAQLSQGTIGLVNLSPYDGCVEAAAARYHMREGCEAFHLRSLSIGFDMEPLVYSEKILGVSFLQEWKAGRHCMPTRVRYDPEPPVDIDPSEAVDLSDFPMKLVEVKVDRTKKGFSKYQFCLPNEIRLLYHAHPIFGPDWTRAIQDFDSQFCTNAAAISPGKTPTRPTDEVKEEGLCWENEPSTLDSMLSLYAVEAKFAGKIAGTTLYVTSAERKDGVETSTAAEQHKKLFMVAHVGVTVPTTTCVIAHGKSTFLKPDKLAKLKRDAAG